MAIALLVLVSIVSLWEFRRRRRPNLLTFRTGDMFVAVAGVSAVLGWVVHLQREFRREEQVVEREFQNGLTEDGTTDTWYDADQVCVAPTWMRSLIGERLLPEFVWRSSVVEIQPWDGREAHAIAEAITKLRYVTRLQIWGDSEEPLNYSAFRRLPELSTIEFWMNEQFDASAISQLAQLTQLKKIVIDGRDETVPPHLLKRLQLQLPDCKIIDSVEDW
jgi:hypothetical protein